MELDNIEKLLKKYFEAETDLVEERMLKKYFSQPEIPGHLEQYRVMFGYFNQEKNETFDKDIAIGSRSKGFKKLYSWLSVAASVLLLIGLFFGKAYYDQEQLEKEKARYAYEETKKALGMLAENFSRGGTEKVAYLNEFVEAKEKIYNKN